MKTKSISIDGWAFVKNHNGNLVDKDSIKTERPGEIHFSAETYKVVPCTITYEYSESYGKEEIIKNVISELEKLI